MASLSVLLTAMIIWKQPIFMKNYTIKPYKQMQILQKDYIKTPLITLVYEDINNKIKENRIISVQHIAVLFSEEVC